MNEEEIRRIIQENNMLKEENKELKKILKEQNYPIPSNRKEPKQNMLENKKIQSMKYGKIPSNDSLNINNNIIDLERDMSTISFLLRSNRRVQILKSLKEANKIPSIIGKEIGDSSHHVSKYLSSLKLKGLVTCLNEEDKRFRFYALTEKGEKYLNLIENNDFNKKKLY